MAPPRSKRRRTETIKVDEKKRKSSKGNADIEDLVAPTAEPKSKTKRSIPPEDWMEIWDLIHDYRQTITAPCDELGASAVPKSSLSAKDYRFQVLVGLMLSAQTKDHVTHNARERLRNAGIFTVDGIIKASVETIDELIYPVGMHKTKAERIKQTALILKEKYASDVPDKLEDLLSLPGVGPKMSHLTLQIAHDRCEGISVDTHVHRIANRLKWVKTKTPVETEKSLESFIPHELWPKVNHVLVGFGQMRCKPVRPECSECVARKRCPSSKIQ